MALLIWRNYRTALAGRATADDARSTEAPRPASFHDLWDHPVDWQGRRVQIRGKVARTFRQDALGSFPPLVEIWLRTPSSDLFCVVFPWNPGDEPTGKPDDHGREVQFTGTFLKSIRYTAADEARLAPLIVGDKPPALVPISPLATTGLGLRPSERVSTQSSSGWNGLRILVRWLVCLMLGLIAAALLAWQHIRGQSQIRYGAGSGLALDGPPLEFIDSEPLNGPSFTSPRST